MMPTRDLVWDEKAGILKCKVVGFFSEADALDAAAELMRMVEIARSVTGSLRLLFDIQLGIGFSARSIQAIKYLKAGYIPGDRTAVLVSNNIENLRSEIDKSAGCKMFTSEFEAVSWLLLQN